MKYWLSLFLLMMVMNGFGAGPVKIMLVTGGHSYDTVQFFRMFDNLPEVEYVHFQQPEANSVIASGKADEYDVLVFYDMWKTIGDTEKAAYVRLTKEGKPFLFLHHSLASYQQWPEFMQLLGGKYVEKGAGIPEEKQSNYAHDVWVSVIPAAKHPVTSGLGEFSLFDEIYGNVIFSEKVIPLFRTNHPESMDVIGWENRFNWSKIIYLQPGHDRRAYEDKNYQKMVLQAIRYLAESK